MVSPNWSGDWESQVPHDLMGNVTEHFTLSELACHHCQTMRIPDDFLMHLESLRVEFGRPMRISSGYRCGEHNARVSNTGMNGPHTKAAVDVLVSGADAYDLIILTQLWGFHGLGVYQRGPMESRFVHLDRRSSRRVWSY